MLMYYLGDRDSEDSSTDDNYDYWKTRIHPDYVKNNSDAIQNKSHSLEKVRPQDNDNAARENKKLLEKVRAQCCSEHIIPPKMPDTVIFRKINLCYK